MSDVKNAHAPTAANVEYARRVYDRAIDWYKVAETKAQLILTINGAFVTIAFGVLTGASDPHTSLESVGPLTWLFVTLALVTLGGAIICAAGALLSQHDRHIRKDFAQLGIDPEDETTYRREVLWYFGHLAKLRWQGVQHFLTNADDRLEVDVLTYNVHGLAKTVLRKHRLINAGWLLTAGTLLSLIGGSAALLLKS